MNLEDLNGKRVMHIDMSNRFKQNRNTGVAYKMIKTNEHKGLGISNKLKRELDRNLNTGEDYSRLYAICIYFLIKNDLDKFDILIVCNDEPFLYVKEYLNILFSGEERYFRKEVSSLAKLREITGDKNIRSHADNIAGIYRRKIFQKVQRRQKGVSLNTIEINYRMIVEKWKEIDKILKKA
ncbi:MAG: hypothetical protein KJ905_01335 [Nanoarchaeota archaeon]|nr:hypothetical protein [Nanoarchaeota archaeon]MBU1501402.1 hypothetical protein [Nanoarchaeota archaeon]MBU2459057.1 hypothetical protein [Nanoarchaeota archaeon]